jgi:hypothetical protein
VEGLEGGEAKVAKHEVVIRQFFPEFRPGLQDHEAVLHDAWHLFVLHDAGRLFAGPVQGAE